MFAFFNSFLFFAIFCCIHKYVQFQFVRFNNSLLELVILCTVSLLPICNVFFLYSSILGICDQPKSLSFNLIVSVCHDFLKPK